MSESPAPVEACLLFPFDAFPEPRVFNRCARSFAAISLELSWLAPLVFASPDAQEEVAVLLLDPLLLSVTTADLLEAAFDPGGATILVLAVASADFSTFPDSLVVVVVVV